MRSRGALAQSFVLCLLTAFLAAVAGPVRGADMFWTTYQYNPSDPAAEHGEVFSLFRANTSDVAGTQMEIVHSIGFQPDYNSLAVAGGRVYLRKFYSHEVYSVNFNGSGWQADNPPSNQVGAELEGRLFDAAGARSYIPDAAAGKIFRGDFEYENQVEIISTPTFVPNMALALDEAAGKIYWAGGGNGARLQIGRANMDGSAPQDLPIGEIYYDDYPADIALDLAAGKMYWINLYANNVQRANMDGSGAEDVIGNIAAFSLAIADVPEPTAGALFAVGIVACAIFLRRVPASLCAG